MAFRKDDQANRDYSRRIQGDIRRKEKIKIPCLFEVSVIFADVESRKFNPTERKQVR